MSSLFLDGAEAPFPDGTKVAISKIGNGALAPSFI